MGNKLPAEGARIPFLVEANLVLHDLHPCLVWGHRELLATLTPPAAACALSPALKPSPPFTRALDIHHLR